MDQIITEKSEELKQTLSDHKAVFTLPKFMAKIILKMPAELTMTALALTTLGN